MAILSCESTRAASSLFSHSTDRAPTRSPYRLKLLENEVETKKLRPAATNLPITAPSSWMPLHSYSQRGRAGSGQEAAGGEQRSHIGATRTQTTSAESPRRSWCFGAGS